MIKKYGLHLILFNYYKYRFNIIIQFNFQILKDVQKIINNLYPHLFFFFLRYKIRRNKKKYLKEIKFLKNNDFKE